MRVSQQKVDRGGGGPRAPTAAALALDEKTRTRRVGWQKVGADGVLTLNGREDKVSARWVRRAAGWDLPPPGVEARR